MKKKLKYPTGCVLVNLDWIAVDILIITSEVKMNEFLKINDPPSDICRLFRKNWNLNRAAVLSIDIYSSIWFFLLLKEKASLVHECVHLAEYISEELGLNFLGKDNEELRAYMVSHIYRTISKRLNLKGV